MKIALSGARGFIGQGLSNYLQKAEHTLYPLVRHHPVRSDREIYWDPALGAIDRDRLEGFDAVIHLAGENLSGYWTSRKKKEIIKSRRDGTMLLSRALADLNQPPSVLVCASAIGYYGHRGEEELSESSSRGKGFLADVCSEWEAAADSARSAGIRVAHCRFGIILDPAGGALARLLPLLRLGLAGRLGSGRQYWSWISLEEVHRALVFVLQQPTLSGPINFTAPQPVTNAEFTKAAAQILHRPAFLAAPSFALRLVLGEMAQEMLLSSARVMPAKLLAAGYPFQHAEIISTLRSILKDKPAATDV